MLPPPPDYFLSRGQQCSTLAVHSLHGQPFPPPDVPDSFPETLWCQSKILLLGFSKLLPTNSSPPPQLLLCVSHSRDHHLPSLLVPCNYLQRPTDNISQKESFFSRTASLTTGVHHDVQGLPPLEAPMALRPQLSCHTFNNGSFEH